MKIPDYISPIVGYRVWEWEGVELKSLNDEPWLPGRPLAARCKTADCVTFARRVGVAHDAHEAPHTGCTCGIYAAKSFTHLRNVGYAEYGVHGEAYLWGTVIEHRLGYRAQFAYPKTLVLPPDMIPFTMKKVESLLETLAVYGTNIFIADATEKVRLWGKVSGFDAAGLDYLIKTRKQYYVRRQRERILKKGDRVALLGRGIALVKQIDDKEALVVWNRLELKIARKDIVLNQQNMRWECEANNA